MSQNNSNFFKKPVAKMLAVFLLINSLVILFKTDLVEKGIDYTVIFAGNIILFLLGFFTLSRSLKAIDNPNPHVFVRSFYAGFLIRLFVCAIAAFIFIYSRNGNVDKGSLFICMGIYAIYSMIEVAALRKVLNEKKNA